MTRSVLASELNARVRYWTDTQNDTHISDQELYNHLTSAASDTWDKITESGLGGEFVKSVYFQTVIGQSTYPLTSAIWSASSTLPLVSPAAVTDFYQNRIVYCNDGNGLWRPVQRVTPDEQYALTAPTTAFLMQMAYLPCAPTFTTGNEVWDGINGWEEHTVQLACIAVKSKKEDDTTQYRTRAREIEARMKDHANRNLQEPPRVIRRRAASRWARRTLPYSGGVGGWDLVNGVLQLYSPSYGMFL